MATNFSLSTFQALQGAFDADAALRRDHDFLTCAPSVARRIVGAEMALLDACINAGMAPSRPDMRGWAAQALTSTLMGA